MDKEKGQSARVNNRPLDFNKIRKRRQRTATLKRLLILTGVMLLVGAAVFVNNMMVEEGVTTRLSDFAESFGGAGFPADLPGGVIRGVGGIGDYLTILNDTNLYIYSSKGKIVRNIQKMTDQTVAIPSSSGVLTFSAGGKGFTVHSLSKEVFSAATEYGVICGDMNARGDFAVVAPVKQFASKVFVYDRRFKEIYSWSSPEYVTSVSLSPKGDMMALNCVSGSEGALESLIYIFRFSEIKDKAEIAMALKDTLCLGIEFAGEDDIQILTDRQYMVLNSFGEKKREYDFGGMQPLAVEKQGKQTLILLGESDGKGYKLALLDQELSEKAVFSLKSQPLDIALARDTVYVLTANGIELYTTGFEIKSRLELSGVSNIHLVGSRLYYITQNEIRVLIPSDLVSAGASSGSSGRTKS